MFIYLLALISDSLSLVNFDNTSNGAQKGEDVFHVHNVIQLYSFFLATNDLFFKSLNLCPS